MNLEEALLRISELEKKEKILTEIDSRKDRSKFRYKRLTDIVKILIPLNNGKEVIVGLPDLDKTSASDLEIANYEFLGDTILPEKVEVYITFDPYCEWAKEYYFYIPREWLEINNFEEVILEFITPKREEIIQKYKNDKIRSWEYILSEAKKKVMEAEEELKKLR